MRKIVIVLGAGASVSAGLPTLGGIFNDPSVQAYLAGAGSIFGDFLEEVVWGPRGVPAGESWRTLNLEEVLTMLRQWRYRHRPDGGREPNPYSPLNHSKNDTLQRQLLGCVFRSVYEGKTGKKARDYNRLLKLVDSEFDHVTWASFNWDALVEQAFYWTFKGEGRLPRCHPDLAKWDGQDEKHLLLKLHGSVTWFSDSGGRVSYARYGASGGKSEVGELWDAYLRSDHDCLQPMIAEPSFFKHEDVAQRPFLLKQWQILDEELVAADLVLVVGYSMPDGDALAKQAVLTALARKKAMRVAVVDPDGLSGEPSGVINRYHRVAGHGLQVFNMTFTEFLDQQSSLLPLI